MKRIGIAVIIVLCTISLLPIHVLLLEHGQTRMILEMYRVRPDDEFTVAWIHSVELTPWEEIFRIDENYEMILDRTRFKQFGAGVPDEAGSKVEIKDGYIIFSGIDQRIERLPLGISAFAQHTLVIHNETILLYERVPDGDRIDFYTGTIRLGSYLYHRFK